MTTAMTVSRSIEVTVDPGDAWSVVGDLGGYHRFVADLKDTPVVSGEGLGALRRCVTTDDETWDETCTVWEPGKKYSVEVDISTYPPRYQSVFSRFTGTWEVEPTDPGSKISITFEAELRPLPDADRLRAMAEAQLAESLGRTLNRYREALQPA